MLIAFSGWFTEDSDAIVIVFPDDDAFAIKQPHINASVLLRFFHETFFILSHYEDESEGTCGRSQGCWAMAQLAAAEA